MRQLFNKIFGRTRKKKYEPLTGKELIFSQYDGLIKNLITLSSDAETQKTLIGFGYVAEEMANEFELYYNYSVQSYLDNNLLTVEQKNELDKIDIFFTNQSSGKNLNFWNDEILHSNPDWFTVRKMALNILKMLHKDNLTIEVERIVENTKSDKGEPIVIERTFTKLVKKNAC